MAAIGAEAVEDLAGEFAGRAQHQHAAGLRLRAGAVGGEVIEDRQREGRGLAGAGLGDADDVALGEQQRDGLGLDRGGGDVFFFGKGAKDRLCEAEIVKGVQFKVFLYAGGPPRMDAGGCRTRGSRHPAWTGLSVREMSENGAENIGAKYAPGSSFTRPGNGLENQAFVPTGSTWQVAVVFSRPIG